MNFESKLNEGVFCIPKCTECKRTVWPPSDFCSYCFGAVVLKEGDFKGKIVEFSRKGEQYFCIIELENSIKIMANITNTPKIGQSVKILKCGINDGNYFFQVI